MKAIKIERLDRLNVRLKRKKALGQNVSINVDNLDKKLQNVIVKIIDNIKET